MMSDKINNTKPHLSRFIGKFKTNTFINMGIIIFHFNHEAISLYRIHRN